jgi:hypothetical protein
MLILRKRVLSRHRHDVHQERRLDPVVLLQQMQKKLHKNGKRRAQAQMDNILWQGRKRKSLNKPQTIFPSANRQRRAFQNTLAPDKTTNDQSSQPAPEHPATSPTATGCQASHPPETAAADSAVEPNHSL